MIEFKLAHANYEVHSGEVERDILAKVFNAARGSSMSMSIRSWLKRFTVTPVSVLEKKDMGALHATANISGE